MKTYASQIGVLFCLTVTALSANASSTICKVSGDSVAPVAISWDTDTNAAKVTFTVEGTLDGRVTLVRKHDSDNKYNLRFITRDQGVNDELEFIVFPTGQDKYRVIGVGYKVINGERFLNVGRGNSEARCNTI